MAAVVAVAPPVRADLAVHAWQQEAGKIAFDRGVALQNKKDRVGAIAAYREAIRLQPDYIPTHVNLAVVLRATGDLAGAAFECREALRRKPDDPGLRVSLSIALQEAGDIEGGITECREAIRVKPVYYQAHVTLGWLLNLNEDLPGAIVEFREAIRLAPQHYIAQSLLGNVLRAQGNLAAANAAYVEALRLSPEYVPAYHGYGRSLTAGGDLAGALIAFRNSARLKPDDEGAWCCIGDTLRAKGDLPGAIAAFREATRLQPDSAEAGVGLGQALAESGDVSAGRSAISIGISRVKLDDAERLANWAWELAVIKDARFRNPARAIELAKKALALKPGRMLSWGTLGVAECQAGKYDDAITSLTKAETLAKRTDPIRGFFLAVACAHLGQQDEASGWFKKAAERMAATKPKDAQLTRFRADAEAALAAASRPATRAASKG